MPLPEDKAKTLIAAAYPIPHDEGCFLDPYYGEDNFMGYLNVSMDEDEDFDPDSIKPFCNCGTEALNEMSARYLRNE